MCCVGGDPSQLVVVVSGDIPERSRLPIDDEGCRDVRWCGGWRVVAIWQVDEVEVLECGW